MVCKLEDPSSPKKYTIQMMCTCKVIPDAMRTYKT